VRRPRAAAASPPASAWSPSASTTRGIRHAGTKRRTISPVPASRPRPGPRATAVFPRQASIRPRAALTDDPDGSAAVMTSALKEATSARTAAGVIAVTRPAPARSAAREASAAAPAIPTLPATTRTCPKVPLCASRGRRGQEPGEIGPLDRMRHGPDRCHGLWRDPMSAISTAPACRQAGGSRCAILGRHSGDGGRPRTSPGRAPRRCPRRARREGRPRGPGRRRPPRPR
jgi:hypothetical protein